MSDDRENEIKPVLRTSKGLQDTLFDEIDNLRNHRTTPQSARTLSSLAGTIIQTGRLEMEFARFVTDRVGGNSSAMKAIEFGSEPVAE